MSFDVREVGDPIGPVSLTEMVDGFLRQAAQIIRFEQAACILAPLLLPSRVIAIANISRVDQSSPYSVWLKKLFSFLSKDTQSGIVQTSQLPTSLDGSKFAPGHMLFLPMDLRGGDRAGFFFMRSQPWTEEERDIALEFSRQCAFRLGYSRRLNLRKYVKIPKLQRLLIAGAALAIAMFPVHLSSVAPAEVVPLQPSVVASSLPGVVRQVHVHSNEKVVAGQLLVTLDDVDQRNKRDITQRDLELTRAELRRLEQMGFLDPTQRFRIAELEAQTRIRELELARANQELSRTQIKAERDGIAILGEASEWAGRPVQVGEKILQIADPSRTGLRIYIPAADIPVLEANEQGEVYLDSQPWRSMAFAVKHWTYEPEVTSMGIVAFRAHAEWLERSDQARLGLRGSAHLKGQVVPLIVYLLRRPIILLRQSFAF